MKDSMIEKYARLIAVMGANIQPGQGVILEANVEAKAFVHVLVEQCYKAGAKWVRVDWIDQALSKLHYAYQSLETLSTLTRWREAQLQEMVDEIPARIYIDSEDPDGLSGVDVEKMQKARQALLPRIRKYSDQIENRQQWTIAAAPSPKWAAKVFPGIEQDEAVEKLWRAIMDACHVTEDNDPVEAWREHNAKFIARCAWLNEKRFDSISYKSANGTDFRAELIEQGMWCGAEETTIGGRRFNPNMPTEEIFTTPMRGKAEGTLVSTKPLAHLGQIIEDFSITFENGRAVRWAAKKGEKLLGHLLTMDEGAACLGELALVPESSPIGRSGILFYSTLFDENAACHVALGRGFNDCIEGFQTKTDEECKALGVNDSMIHVDFMIGAPDLSITGWKDGVPTPIFVNGEWAADI